MLTNVMSLALSLVLASAQALPPYEFETMYWGWVGPQNNSWTQCRQLTLQWWQIKGTTPPIKAPYTATFFLENYEPYVLDLGVGRPNGIYLEYNWIVDLPTGGPFQASIVDANGATAGDTSYLYVLGESPPVSACNPVNLTPSRLKMTTSGNLDQCATVNITVTGGTAPYTLNVVQQDIAPKVVKYSTGSFQYVLDNTAARNVSFSITDANGLGVTGPLFAVGQSTDVSCLTLAQSLNPLSPELSTVYPGVTFATPTGGNSASATNGGATASTGGPIAASGSTSKGAIIGGAVAAVALLILAAVIGALWQRRRARRSQPRLDMGEAFAPTSATGITTTPFIPQDPYNNRDSAVSMPYSRGASSSYADAFPPIASPPYSPPASESMYSGSGSGGQRFSADSKTGLMTGGTASSNPDPDIWRAGGSSSPLPAGAARPLSPAMGVQDLEERAAQLGYELNPARSPPPMYPTEKRNY